ncbi:MAG: hypothetical protein ABJK39_11380 [Hyphomicrobiales bacterium]
MNISIKISLATAIITVGSFSGAQTAFSHSSLCQALQNGATWTARDNSQNAGKAGKIKLKGGCSVGSSGVATITWDGETVGKKYKVGSRTLYVGGKGYRAREKSDGTWTVFNTSSPL